MSHQPSNAVHHMAPPAEQSPEGIRFAPIIVIGLVSLAIFAGASLWALAYMHRAEAEIADGKVAREPSEVGKVEIGIVDQVPFDVTHSLEHYKREKVGHLESWGWIDRKAGTVHMPIGDAMDLVVKEHQK